VERVITEAREHPGPALMDFKCDPTALVYPMVPAGKAIHEMLLPPDPPAGG
jgi:acetolactate synthase-1/2/3 large subunit